jgi:hypothetical protein
LEVEAEEELSGGGDEGDFGRFAGGAQAAVEGGQRARRTADDAQGGKVEGASHPGSAAADMALAAAGAAVGVVRSQAGEGGDLAAGGLAEFGEEGQEGEGGERSDAVLSLEGGIARGQGAIGGDVQARSGFQGGDLLLQDARERSQGALAFPQLEMLGGGAERALDADELGAQVASSARARVCGSGGASAAGSRARP